MLEKIHFTNCSKCDADPFYVTPSELKDAEGVIECECCGTMLKPIGYKYRVQLRELDQPGYDYIQNDSDIQKFLDYLGVPKKYRANITGMVLIIHDGDIDSAWLSESSRPYDISSWYHALPYYYPKNWSKKNKPCYWLESNTDYWE